MLFEQNSIWEKIFKNKLHLTMLEFFKKKVFQKIVWTKLFICLKKFCCLKKFVVWIKIILNLQLDFFLKLQNLLFKLNIKILTQFAF